MRILWKLGSVALWVVTAFSALLVIGGFATKDWVFTVTFVVLTFLIAFGAIKAWRRGDAAKKPSTPAASPESIPAQYRPALPAGETLPTRSRRASPTPRSAATPLPPAPPLPPKAPAPRQPPIAPAPVMTRPRAPRSAPPTPKTRRGTPEPIFGYAQAGASSNHEFPFAIVDVETTGFSPQSGDRVVEIAILRMDKDGKVEDEFSTLVNPEGHDVGPTFVHHITNEAVRNAPTFSDISDQVLERLAGAIVVAHNAPFEDRFLSHELARSGHSDVKMPALCSLWLAQRSVNAPNYKLGTLAHEFGVSIPDAHAALGDVRAVSKVLPQLLDAHHDTLGYPVMPYLHQPSGATSAAALVTRAASLRKGDAGWMNTLVSRLPMHGSGISERVSFAYFDALTSALEDGRIIGDEAKHLARIAGQAGLGAGEVRTLNGQFLESLRLAAFEDAILTQAELVHLQRAADALGMASYFDDLSATTGPTAPAPVDSLPKKPRRCGHCGEVGHYRPRCPQLQTP